MDGRADVYDYYFRVFPDFKQENHTTVQYVEMNSSTGVVLESRPLPLALSPTSIRSPPDTHSKARQGNAKWLKALQLENSSEILPSFQSPILYLPSPSPSCYTLP